jgi:hypothetical protein
VERRGWVPAAPFATIIQAQIRTSGLLMACVCALHFRIDPRGEFRLGPYLRGAAFALQVFAKRINFGECGVGAAQPTKNGHGSLAIGLAHDRKVFVLAVIHRTSNRHRSCRET